MNKLFPLAVLGFGCICCNHTRCRVAEPEGTYMEALYKYENTYGPDSLMERVVMRYYVVKWNLEIPDGKREFRYRHTHRGGRLIRTERYEILADGRQAEPEVTVFFPDGRETFMIRDGDTVDYEQVRYDQGGRIVYEKSFSKGFSLPEYFMEVHYRFVEKRNVYNDAGRLSAYDSFNILVDHALRRKVRIEYSGDTGEITRQRIEVTAPED